MQKHDGQIAHGTILQDREILRNAHESAIRRAQVVRTPFQAPQANGVAERFVRTTGRVIDTDTYERAKYLLMRLGWRT